VRRRQLSWKGAKPTWRNWFAEGLTDKQLGTRLFISERTVDSDIRSILKKLAATFFAKEIR